MKPNMERIQKTLSPYFFEQNGRRCMFRENVDIAIQQITGKFSDCYCEVSPHPNFPVTVFRVARARTTFFEAIIIG